VFPKLKFKPKIKIKSPIELQHHRKENEGLPSRVRTYFTLKPAHISLKALILPNCNVIITKTIRSLDALSLPHPYSGEVVSVAREIVGRLIVCREESR
jgi:hypothetical protein